MPICSKCQYFLLFTYAFCPGCTTPNPAFERKKGAVIDVDDDIANEVRQQKEKQRLKDRSSSTLKSSSIFGIEPKPTPSTEHKTIELWVPLKGETPTKLPNGFKIWPMNPQQIIEPTLEQFIRDFAINIRGWRERSDPENLEEDWTRDAWIGVIFGNHGIPHELEIDSPSNNNITCQDFLAMLVPYKKDRIALVLPVKITRHWEEEVVEPPTRK